MADVKLQAVLTLKDQMTGELKKSEGAFSKWAKVGVAAAGAVVVGIGVKAVKAAADFEQSLSNVSTLISGDSTQTIKELGDGIKEMMKTIPVSADDLGGSAYLVASAGISGTAEQLLVLEEAAKLGVAGLGSTESSVKVLTGALNTFGYNASQSNEVSDILFKTVKNGITDIDKFTQSFGATAPIMAGANISLEEFAAASAALTTTTTPASVAQTNLKTAVLALQAPTAEMKRLFGLAGIESGQLALENDGLVETMRKVNDAAGGDAEALKKAFGSSEALSASIALTGEQGDAFNSTLEDMKNGSNSVDEAFQKQTETSKAQYDLLQNNLNVAMIDLGNKILPILIDLLPKITDFIEDMAGGWDELTTTIADVIIWFDNLWAKVEEVWGNITGFFSDMGKKSENINLFGWKPFEGKASGGSVSAGTPYVVGEKGAEMFVPNSSGTIIPNDKMGGSITVNFNNATVRNDSDLQSIINAVKQSLNRDLSIEQLGI